MANYTPNLNLTKPLVTEQYSIDIFNANYDILDRVINENNVAGNLLTKIKTVDGAGSGLDSDLVRGKSGDYYDLAWYPEVAYQINSIRSYNGILYKSLYNNNIGNNPASSEKWEMFTIGAEPSVIVRAKDVVYDDTTTNLEASDLQKAFENLYAKVTILQTTINQLTTQLGGGGGFFVQPSAPTNTNGLWIDTSNKNTIKYYNKTTLAWEYVGSVYS